MACSKWEELGLLYCSRELNEQDTKLFEEHMTECVECRTENDDYQREKSLFYTTEILGEEPSAKVDAEIKRVCTAKKQYTNVHLFSTVMKKSGVSISLFLLGFLVIGYFAFNIENARNQKQNMANSNPPAISAPKESTSVASTSDSMANNAKDSASYYSRGNLDTKGVYPVDLK